MAIDAELITAIITSAGVTGVLGGAITYWKDRKKDAATAKLTDVQALQQSISLMEQVVKFLRAENERLQADYNQSEAARRVMRTQMMALEDELQKVKYNAAQTQRQCDALSKQLKTLITEGGRDLRKDPGA